MVSIKDTTAETKVKMAAILSCIDTKMDVASDKGLQDVAEIQAMIDKLFLVINGVYEDG